MCRPRNASALVSGSRRAAPGAEARGSAVFLLGGRALLLWSAALRQPRGRPASAAAPRVPRRVTAARLGASRPGDSLRAVPSAHSRGPPLQRLSPGSPAPAPQHGEACPKQRRVVSLVSHTIPLGLFGAALSVTEA